MRVVWTGARSCGRVLFRGGEGSVMAGRWGLSFRPDVERLEPKRPLSTGVAAGALTPAQQAVERIAAHHAEVVNRLSPGAGTVTPVTGQNQPVSGYLLYRITNPNSFNNKLTPPFTNFLVQSTQPVPGQVYNVLYLAVRNGTAQQFTATNSNFLVRFPGQPQAYPILTGSRTWDPGKWFVFYVLTKKYYPIQNVVHGGFEFNLDGARSAAIPGPSAI